ncbi:MarR family transcriptional regulator [Paenibacillus lautus]|uniref:MarR family transcriptional regulator n=2 Tax=Paenibacillus TaxID=44249 RepID=UPI00188CB23C|nr:MULTISPECIES: MarR family transcriptional regulator [Paenibacillus]MBX4148597.1 MarR family transcriptional regulator [Paenibacillus lautus]
MNTLETIKWLVHDQVVHFVHLSEQRIESEQDKIFRYAQEQQLESIPRHLTSVHVIDCIGNNEPINNTTLAEKMNLSKAGITKISGKLLEEGYIHRRQLNDNKKEVYFSLTVKGKQVFELHKQLHKLEEKRFMQLLDSFKEAELHVILRFLQSVSTHWAKEEPE